MAIPAGYTLGASGFYYKSDDGSGPFVVDTTGTVCSPPVLVSGRIPVDCSGANSPVVGNVAGGATDSGAPVKVGAVYNSTLPTYTTGQRADLQAGTRGALNVQMMVPDSTVGMSNGVNSGDAVANLAGSNRALSVIGYGYIQNGASWDRDTKATTYHHLPSSAATTNATSVKASAGTIHHLSAGKNTSGADKFFHVYNKASAPTVGTDVPVLTFTIPAGQPMSANLGPNGGYFSAGIAYAITGGSADNDNTAVASGDVTGLNIAYV